MNNKGFDCFLKINWAGRQLEQLEQEIINWFKDGKTYSQKITPNPEETNTFLLEVYSDPIPIAPFSLMIGDIVQNIRSSLDHIVYELGENNNHPEFVCKSHMSQFPIIGNESNSGNSIDGSKSFSESIKKTIKYIIPEAQQFIKSVQPFNEGNQFHEHPLWLLNKLSNIDKHRFLHVGSGYAGACIIKKCFVEGNAGRIPLLEQNNKTVIKLPKLTPLDPAEDLNDLVSPKMTICFQEGALVKKPIVGTLASIHSYVGNQVLTPLGKYLK